MSRFSQFTGSGSGTVTGQVIQAPSNSCLQGFVSMSGQCLCRSLFPCLYSVIGNQEPPITTAISITAPFTPPAGWSVTCTTVVPLKLGNACYGVGVIYECCLATPGGCCTAFQRLCLGILNGPCCSIDICPCLNTCVAPRCGYETMTGYDCNTCRYYVVRINSGQCCNYLCCGNGACNIFNIWDITCGCVCAIPFTGSSMGGPCCFIFIPISNSCVGGLCCNNNGVPGGTIARVCIPTGGFIPAAYFNNRNNSQCAVCNIGSGGIDCFKAFYTNPASRNPDYAIGYNVGLYCYNPYTGTCGCTNMVGYNFQTNCWVSSTAAASIQCDYITAGTCPSSMWGCVCWICNYVCNVGPCLHTPFYRDPTRVCAGLIYILWPTWCLCCACSGQNSASIDPSRFRAIALTINTSTGCPCPLGTLLCKNSLFADMPDATLSSCGVGVRFMQYIDACCLYIAERVTTNIHLNGCCPIFCDITYNALPNTAGTTFPISSVTNLCGITVPLCCINNAAGIHRANGTFSCSTGSNYAFAGINAVSDPSSNLFLIPCVPVCNAPSLSNYIKT